MEVAARQYHISSTDPKAQIIMVTEEKEDREWEWMDQTEYGNTTSKEVKMI